MPSSSASILQESTSRHAEAIQARATGPRLKLLRKWQEENRELLRRAFEELPEELARPPSAAVLQDVAKGCICQQDGGEFCTLCGKHSTPSHSASKDHVRKVAMQHQLTLLCGDSSARQLMTGHAGPCTKVALSAYWGDALSDFPIKALARLRASGLKVKVGTRPERFIDGSSVLSVNFNVMPFWPGCSKYTMSQSVEWCSVPDQADSGMLEQKVSLTGSQTWWPVVGIHSHELPRPRTGGGDWYVCVYQLLAPTPSAWWAEHGADADDELLPLSFGDSVWSDSEP
jgi:hypothetical protein